MKQSGSQQHICPVAQVAELLSDTWTMLIIHNLLQSQTMRFCEMERVLEGISTRTLTIKLKYLEEEGIIQKSDEGYGVTKLGIQLQPVLVAMGEFGKKLK